MYQPYLADTGALVSSELYGPIVAGRTRREDFCEPVRGTTHTALIDLLKVGNDKNVRLNHGIDLVVLFVRLG
jgi:hypothetical protein